MNLRHLDWSRNKTVSGNQRDQSMGRVEMSISTLREKMSTSAPFIRGNQDLTVTDYPFNVDPVMAGDKILANVCRMCPDNFELEMLTEE